MTYEETQELVDQLVQLEIEDALSSRDLLIDIVSEYVKARYERLDEEQIMDLAVYYGIIEEAE